ncbi:hypothetical protein [Magnetococcus marinus]|uniref:hypothetical protein n=1 Tax=Magnetococcus marinus TaxID=1124597 RepID=UPI0002FB4DB5|nr:hypothetical protein [Magnetococcus marinus]
MFDPDYINANPMGLTTWCHVANRRGAQTLAQWLLTHEQPPVDKQLIPRIIELLAEQACTAEPANLETMRQRLARMQQARPEWWGQPPREYRWDQRLERLDQLARYTLKQQDDL